MTLIECIPLPCFFVFVLFCFFDSSTLFLLACQVTAIVGESGLCSCVPCYTCDVRLALSTHFDCCFMLASCCSCLLFTGVWRRGRGDVRNGMCRVFPQRSQKTENI